MRSRATSNTSRGAACASSPRRSRRRRCTGDSRSLGFDLYQGYFFARPDVYESERIEPNKLVVLELLARVSQPEITPGGARRDHPRRRLALRHGAALGELARSAGLRSPVESIQRAIVVLGLQTIRNWVALLALARMGASPSELLKMLLVRARCCELLAGTAQLPNAASFFTVGLLSALDVILKVEMTRALELVALVPSQKAALLQHEGEFGAALAAVIALECGDFGAARFQALSFETIRDCYLSAIAWADNLAATGQLPG